MWIEAKGYSVFGYGAVTSPSIFNDNNYCYLVFYYKLIGNMFSTSSASLSIFFEEANGNKSTALWSTTDTIKNWKKEVIKLPNTSSNYSVLLLGYTKAYGYVLIDDMGLIRCDSCKV